MRNGSLKPICSLSKRSLSPSLTVPNTCDLIDNMSRIYESGFSSMTKVENVGLVTLNLDLKMTNRMLIGAV